MSKPHWKTYGDMLAAHRFPADTAAQGAQGWAGIVTRAVNQVVQQVAQQYGYQAATNEERDCRDNLLHAQVWLDPQLQLHFDPALYKVTLAFLKLKATNRKADMKKKAAASAGQAGPQHAAPPPTASFPTALAPFSSSASTHQYSTTPAPQHPYAPPSVPATSRKRSTRSPSIKDEDGAGDEQRRTKRRKLSSDTDEERDEASEDGEEGVEPGKEAEVNEADYLNAPTKRRRRNKNSESQHGPGLHSVPQYAPGSGRISQNTPEYGSASGDTAEHRIEPHHSVRPSIEAAPAPVRVDVALVSPDGALLLKTSVRIPSLPDLTRTALLAILAAKPPCATAISSVAVPLVLAFGVGGTTPVPQALLDDDDCATFQSQVFASSLIAWTLWLCDASESTGTPITLNQFAAVARGLQPGERRVSARPHAPPPPLDRASTVRKTPNSETAPPLDALAEPRGLQASEHDLVVPQGTPAPPTSHSSAAPSESVSAAQNGTQWNGAPDTTAQSRTSLAQTVADSHGPDASPTQSVADSHGLDVPPTQSVADVSQDGAAPDAPAQIAARYDDTDTIPDSDPSVPPSSSLAGPLLQFEIDADPGAVHDENDTMEPALVDQLHRLTAGLCQTAQIDHASITAYCTFFGRDLASWHPRAKSDTIGLKGVFEYQLFTMWWSNSEVEGGRGYFTQESAEDQSEVSDEEEPVLDAEEEEEDDSDSGEDDSPPSAGDADRAEDAPLTPAEDDEDDEDGEDGEDAGPAFNPVGGTVGHKPGLGKTLCGVGCGVLGACCWANFDHIAEHPEQHLRSGGDGTVCPSATQMMERFGFRCLCEPANRNLFNATNGGATILVCLPSLIRGWNKEITDRVDAKRFKEITGGDLEVLVAHRHASKLERAKFSSRVKTFLPRAPRIADWAAANPEMSADDLTVALSRNASDLKQWEVELQAPPVRLKDTSTVFVLTTVQSFPTQFADQSLYNFKPSFHKRSVACDKGFRCINSSGKCTAKTHLRTYQGAATMGFPVARFIWDEAHLFKDGKGVIGRLASLIAHPAGHRPASWTYTGTPLSSRPTDMLPLFAAQATKDWAHHDHLRPFSGTIGQKLIDCDVMVSKHTSKATLPTGQEFRKHLGIDKPTNDSEAAATLQERYNEIVVQPMQQWISDFVIQIKEDDEWEGQKMVELPRMTRSQAKFELSPEAIKTVEDVILRYMTLSERLTNLRLSLAKSVPRADVDQAREKVKAGWRYLQAVLNFPALHPHLQGDLSPLFQKTLLERGWWDDPEKCFLYPYAAELRDSSPKVKYLLRRIENRPQDVVTLLPWSTDKDLVEHKYPVHHARKMVIAVSDVTQAFILYVILHHHFKSRGHAPEKMVGCIRSGTDFSRVVQGFQLEGYNLSKEPSSVESLDLIIMSTKVGGVGLTLNRGEIMYHLDVDPQRSRKEQTPARLRRIGVEHETFFEQLITHTFEIDEKSIQVRDAGGDTVYLLLNPKRESHSGGAAMEGLTNGQASMSAQTS